MSRISSVRGKIASALECTDCDACASISRHRRPRRAHSFARKSPTGPAPTISTSVSRRGSDMMRSGTGASRVVRFTMASSAADVAKAAPPAHRDRCQRTDHAVLQGYSTCVGVHAREHPVCRSVRPPTSHHRARLSTVRGIPLANFNNGAPPWRRRRRASDNVSEDGSADRRSTADGRRVPSRVSSPSAGDSHHDARSGARTDIERDRSAPEDRSRRCGPMRRRGSIRNCSAPAFVATD